MVSMGDWKCVVLIPTNLVNVDVYCGTMGNQLKKDRGLYLWMSLIKGLQK